MLASDVHLGYKQDDPIRSKDSFYAFREVLQIARSKQVDFVLLAGDLFHVNKPAQRVEHKTIKILREHLCQSSQSAATFKRVKGDFSHFKEAPHPNWEDKMLTVRFPILTIHGNHDNPTGANAKSICEKLADSGLLNYFGNLKLDPDGKTIVKPIVLQKKDVKLAIYGMGHIPDVKLKQAFDEGRIVFEAPPSDTFNILVVHQNRVGRVENRYIPDIYYPEFIHLLIRGHEHDAEPEPTKGSFSSVGGYAFQPGSTVQTSLTFGESLPKSCCVFSVELKDPEGDQSSRYSLGYETKILRCARKLITCDISKDMFAKEIVQERKHDYSSITEYREDLMRYAETKVQKLLEDDSTRRESIKVELNDLRSLENFEKVRTVYSKLETFLQPLMRIRIEYKDREECFDDHGIVSMFYPDKLANRDIIYFKKQKLKQGPNCESRNITFQDHFGASEDEEDQVETIDLADQRRDTIEGMLEAYFAELPENEQLNVLSLREYVNAVRGSEEEGNVISKVMSKRRDMLLKQFSKTLGEDQAVQELYCDEEKVKQWYKEAFEATRDKPASEKREKPIEIDVSSSSDDDECMIVSGDVPPAPKAGVRSRKRR